VLLKKHVAIQEPIREPLLFTTVAHSSINAPSRKRDVHRFRVACSFPKTVYPDEGGTMYIPARRRLGFRVAFFGVPAAGWVLFWRSITCPAPREKYKQYLNESIRA